MGIGSSRFSHLYGRRLTPPRVPVVYVRPLHTLWIARHKNKLLHNTSFRFVRELGSDGEIVGYRRKTSRATVVCAKCVFKSTRRLTRCPRFDWKKKNKTWQTLIVDVHFHYTVGRFFFRPFVDWSLKPTNRSYDSNIRIYTRSSACYSCRTRLVMTFPGTRGLDPITKHTCIR